MWVKRNGKTVFIDSSEYFLNFGNIENDGLKKIIVDTKYNEIIKLFLPKKMVSEIQEAFSLLDSEGNGAVGERDIKVTLRAIGIEPTAKKIKKLIEKVSDNKAGELSREDYETMMIHVFHDIDSDEQMEKSFQVFDADGSGVISIERLKTIADQLELNLADEELQEMIHIADSDKDGAVTKEEFMDIARKMF